MQFKEGDIFINNKKILRKKINTNNLARCGKSLFEVDTFEETLPNGKKHIAIYSKSGTTQNTKNNRKVIS